MTTSKMVKTLAEAKQSKEPVACPYCAKGRIEYDITDDVFQCSGCCREISGEEYEKLTESVLHGEH